MGKIFRGAEVTRIYVGSFSDDEIRHKEQFGALFKKDHQALVEQIKELPGMCCMRKVNEMVKRIRLCVVHTCVLGHLRSKMPMLYGAEAARGRLIKDLDVVFEEVRNQYHLSEGDMPSIDEFRGVLQRMDFYSFPPIDRKVLNQLQEMLTVDIPKIIGLVSGVSADANMNGHHVKGSGHAGSTFLNIFTFEEEDEKKQQQVHSMGSLVQSQHTMVIIIAVLVLAIALLVGSVLDEHQIAMQVQEHVQRLLEDIQRNFKERMATATVEAVDTSVPFTSIVDELK